MVSPLWKACSEGDFQKVQELLGELAGIDIELKDYTGVTPLIEAVRNGHVEIIKLLLEKGADPTNASKDGRPETYTSDLVILGMLQEAQNKFASAEVPQQSTYPQENNDDSEKQFYVPPPVESFMYYHPINPNHPPMAEGTPFYAVTADNGIGHLPPPEIARLIPCRYFPACRYGSQCMFLHPPYYQGAPMPPYPPYDPMGAPYGPHFYPPPPPSFPPPASVHPIPPMSSSPNSGVHARSPSEIVSPVPPSFNQNGAPPPPPTYGPPLYPPGQGPIHMPIPPLPPHPGHHSPHNLYNPSSVAPYPIAPDGPYPQGQLPNVHYPDAGPGDGPESSTENSMNHSNGVNGIGHHRRGSMRRSSFGSRKPPCLFFPSGRCKNGDECRFPHVLPENGGIPTHQTLPQGRNGPSRPPRGQSNGQGSLVDRLNNLNLRDDQRPKNGVDATSRLQSGETGHRSKFLNGKHHPGLNGYHNHNKKGQPAKQPPPQRVPNADEFPVLAGSITPPKLVNGTHFGLTAAQVLQAPPPVKKEASKESSTRGTTPEPARGPLTKDAKTDINGTQEKTAPVAEQTTSATVNKLPIMSFAAAAASTAANADLVKEVSVSA